MNIERAKKLLEQLRVRTEARGATAAEAAQAAELADKLAKRYGLDREHSTKVEDECQIKYKRFPGWCYWLVRGIEKRFHCSASQRHGNKTGHAKVVFVGAEHDVSVACWLFRAVLNDLHRKANALARERGYRGGELVRFRNAFIDDAGFAVYMRLNPPKPIDPETRAKYLAEAETCLRKKHKRLSKAELAKKNFESQARFAGFEAGEKVQLGTNVLGEDAEPLRLELRVDA